MKDEIDSVLIFRGKLVKNLGRNEKAKKQATKAGKIYVFPAFWDLRDTYLRLSRTFRPP